MANRYKARDPDAQRLRQLEWVKQRRASRETWHLQNYQTLRTKCRSNGTRFEITKDDIAAPVDCPICENALVFGELGHPRSPSVDKVLPELGYVKGNVNVICRRCNLVKNNETSPRIFRRIADYVEGKL